PVTLMDIREAISAEHSKRQTMAIVDYIGGDPDRFAELMKIFFEGVYRPTQRSAWPMSVCAEKHPELIEPYVGKLVDQLPRSDVHNAVKRNVLRLLQFVEIPRRLEGKVYSLCLDLISDPNEMIGIHAFSITVAAKIAAGKPDLIDELRLVIKENLKRTSPGIRVRLRNIMPV
ncbi:MAG: hypothetical protein ABIV21_08840, partial [Pyrinomonadaceae bacterium]